MEQEITEESHADLYRQITELVKENRGLYNDMSIVIGICDEKEETILKLQVLCRQAADQLEKRHIHAPHWLGMHYANCPICQLINQLRKCPDGENTE